MYDMVRAGGFLLLCLTWSAAHALDNGMSITPAMGFNTWSAFGLDVNETLVERTAELMVSLGLRELGFEYIVVDDGWSEPKRDARGALVPNRAKFPSGMASLASNIHVHGFKFGMYADAGARTCGGFPGSRGREQEDAAAFAAWGADYLKYDNCNAAPEDSVQRRYTTMRDALNATGRPLVYSLCEWGVEEPWLWGGALGNSWRTTGDSQANWLSIQGILDNNIGLARFGGPGAWNDPDMLQLGNGDLSAAEGRSHFALWALLKAPLMISTRLDHIDRASLETLRSPEVIAIHQDALGIAGDLIWKQGSKEIYAGPLTGGRRAVVLFNRARPEEGPMGARITGTIDLVGARGEDIATDTEENDWWHMWEDLEVANPREPRQPPDFPTVIVSKVRWEQLGYEPRSVAAVRDLYARQDFGTFRAFFSATVAPHDVLVLSLTPVAGPGRRGTRDDGWRPWHGQPMYQMHDEDLRVGSTFDLGAAPVRISSSGDYQEEDSGASLLESW